MVHTIFVSNYKKCCILKFSIPVFQYSKMYQTKIYQTYQQNIHIKTYVLEQEVKLCTTVLI